MSFDRTRGNTRQKNGAYHLSEVQFGKELLWLTCRYYIFKLVIGAVLDISFGLSSRSEIEIFKKFKRVGRFSSKIIRNLHQVNLIWRFTSHQYVIFC